MDRMLVNSQTDAIASVALDRGLDLAKSRMDPDGPKRLPRLPVLLIVGLAIVPRVLRLTASLCYDETFASRLKLSFTPQGFAWIFYDTHPPFYNFLMLLWNHVFGESEISLRMLPLVSSLAAIVLLVRIAREISDERVALVAGI